MTKRRDFIRKSVLGSTGIAFGGLGLSSKSHASIIGLNSFTQNLNDNSISNKKLKVVVVGAHPDDPETMCGGTIALFGNAGHEVVSAYLTRGERGIQGISHEEAAKIRTEEAIKANLILKARAEFLGQINGRCEITHITLNEMYEFLKKESPDIVFTHWPIDTHRDHRICSNLVLDAWLQLDRKFNLFYCEVMTGTQSQNFPPTDYVDISSVIKQKHDACYCHKSQKIEEEYPLYHGRMEIFRGMEYNCEYAEAFVRHFQGTKSSLIQ
jgi:LmbE family N-acetylglucosaminyl deacetylase